MVLRLVNKSSARFKNTSLKTECMNKILLKYGTEVGINYLCKCSLEEGGF